jgi:hypothetical protein
MDFPLGGYVSPDWAKHNLPRKKRTLLPQAKEPLQRQQF